MKINIKTKRDLEIISSPFLGCHKCSEILFLEIHRLAIFDALIRKGF